MENEYQKFDDKRAMSGYGSMLLVKKATDSLYSLLLPLETTPSVFGSVDTFDFDLLTSKTKGKVEGKESLDSKEVEYMWHRDNVVRLEALQKQILDFLQVFQDFTGRTFSGSIKVRPNDSGAEIQKGTFTITPLSASSTTLLDCRDLIQDTVVFASQVPTSLTIGSTATEVEIATLPAKTAVTLAVECDNENFTVTPTQATSSSNAKISIAKIASPEATPQYGIVKITASASGYASWITTIAVNY